MLSILQLLFLATISVGTLAAPTIPNSDYNTSASEGFLTSTVLDDYNSIELDKRDSKIIWAKRTQKQARYHLQMISISKKKKLKTKGRYDFSNFAGKGVDVYVMDTGVRTTHDDFKRPVKSERPKGPKEVYAHHFSANSLVSDVSPFDITGETMEDVNGHGTHVAGIVAAQKYGIARRAAIWNVKVMSDVIYNWDVEFPGDEDTDDEESVDDEQADEADDAEDNDEPGHEQEEQIQPTVRVPPMVSIEGATKAIYTIAERHLQRIVTEPEKFRGSIINMSWGWAGLPDPRLKAAIDYAASVGIVSFAAAMNSGVNIDPAQNGAGGYPCAYKNVICIGSVGQSYKVSGFSNWGTSVAFVAPGEDICKSASLLRRTPGTRS
jgi:subtilisin family serine protease